MSDRDVHRLQHMQAHAREAIALAAERSRVDLDEDRVFSLAMTRLLEIVGEAAARISEETRMQLPDIPWPDIVSLRNRLIHGYDAVDHDILWNIVREDLPLLVEQMESHLT